MKSSTFQAIFWVLLIFCNTVQLQPQTKPAKKEGSSSVSGKVTIKGKGAPGIIVGLRGADSGGQLTSRLKATTDQDGNYRITNVGPGTYSVIPATRLFVSSGESRGKTLIITEGETVEGVDFALVRGGVITGKADITGLELVNKPLGAISGHVTLESSKAAECKGKRRPLLTETLVTAWHNEKNEPKEQPQFFWSLGRPSSVDKQGNISLRNLAPGQYHFSPRFSAKYWYLHFISMPSSVASGPKSTQSNREVDAARNWTTVKAGERLTGLIIKLAEGAASLQGKITLAEGETIPERLYVYLIPAEREKTDDVLRFFAAPILPDGKIVLNNLAPGRYWIIAQPAIDSASPLTKMRLPGETETRAKLRREAEVLKTEIEFKPCQNVTDYQLTLKSSVAVPPKKDSMSP
ncbi:MAG TPA: carboxypeptidase-like regulatory domain-containing protein [Pyrinomonadaceae bacterium]|nr:carboxypeptidase-like regulatory domain-containing protein [Pyrinomonadaceae bacterium]